VYAPTDLIAVAVPVLKSSEHFSSSCPTRDASISGTLDAGRQAAARSRQQGQGMVFRAHRRRHQSEGWATGTSAATRRIWVEIPDAGKYFMSGGRAVGYLASKDLLTKRGEDYAAYMANPALEQYHFIGKDIVTFHTLFWPAMHFSGRNA
jgi:methionyl-tRNA synthetase